NRPAIVVLGFAIILLVVVDCSQIDTGSRVPRIEFQNSPVSSKRLLLARWSLLHRHSRDEQLRGCLSHARLRNPGLNNLRPVKRQQKLPREWIQFASLVPESKARSTRKHSGFKQR